MHTIKTVTTLTSLSSETLRAWERRYGAVIPQRDAKGRRTYSQQEVDRLSLLNQVTQQGFSIGKVANLDDQALQDLLAANADGAQANEHDVFFNKVISALKNYRFDISEDLLRRAMIAMEPLDFAENILLPTFHKVGVLWHEGKITIAQEHLFSESVKRLVLSMINAMSAYSHRGPLLLFTTLSGEVHEFGILLTRLVAAQQHCKAYYLGTELPWDELVHISAKLNPTVIVSSCVTSPPPPHIISAMQSLAENLPATTELWVGGVGAYHLHEQQLLPQRFELIADLNDFNKRLQTMLLQSV